MRRHSAIALGAAGLAAIAGQATAQDITFRLVQSQSVDVLSSDPQSPFWIGNNPSAIAFDGDALYVAGFHNGGSDVPAVSVVQISNFLAGPGQREFRTIAGGQIATTQTGGDVTAFRGWSGLDWDDEFGLLGTVDKGNAGIEGQLLWFNRVDPTPGDPDPVALELKGTSVAGRGVAGPSWDRGFMGLGFDYNGDGEPDGPAAALLDFSSGGPAVNGPLGFVPDMLMAPPFLYTAADGGPFLNIQDLSGTIWRDMHIDPTTGNIAARAANDLVIGIRGEDGTLDSAVLVDGGNAPFVVGQNVQILYDVDDNDDMVLWINRPDGAVRAFTDAVRLAGLDGSALAYDIVDENGSPVTLPDGIGYYSVSWHPGTQLLMVCDFNSRTVFVLEPVVEGDECIPDFAPPFGVLDIFDVLEFLALFEAGCP